MATLASDDFDRGDSDSLGSDWTEESGDIDILSNRAKSTDAAIASWAGTFNPAGADYDVEAALEKKGAVGASDLIGRFADTDNYYLLQLNTFTQHLVLYSKVAGDTTELGSFSGGYSNNNVYTSRLEMIGTAIKGFQPSGTQRVSVSDSDLSATGVPAIRGQNADAYWDDFIVTGDEAAPGGVRRYYSPGIWRTV